MRDFEKHQFRKQYPNAARLYHEKIEEKRRIAKNIKRGMLASKKSIVKEQSDKEAAIKAEEENPNDFQEGEEMFECEEDYCHENSNFEEDQCHENSDFGEEFLYTAIWQYTKVFIN